MTSPCLDEGEPGKHGQNSAMSHRSAAAAPEHTCVVRSAGVDGGTPLLLLPSSETQTPQTSPLPTPPNTHNKKKKKKQKVESESESQRQVAGNSIIGC